MLLLSLSPSSPPSSTFRVSASVLVPNHAARLLRWLLLYVLFFCVCACWSYTRILHAWLSCFQNGACGVDACSPRWAVFAHVWDPRFFALSTWRFLRRQHLKDFLFFLLLSDSTTPCARVYWSFASGARCLRCSILLLSYFNDVRIPDSSTRTTRGSAAWQRARALGRARSARAWVPDVHACTFLSYYYTLQTHAFVVFFCRVLYTLRRTLWSSSIFSGRSYAHIPL